METAVLMVIIEGATMGLLPSLLRAESKSHKRETT